MTFRYHVVMFLSSGYCVGSSSTRLVKWRVRCQTVIIGQFSICVSGCGNVIDGVTVLILLHCVHIDLLFVRVSVCTSLTACFVLAILRVSCVRVSVDEIIEECVYLYTKRF